MRQELVVPATSSHFSPFDELVAYEIYKHESIAKGAICIKDVIYISNKSFFESGAIFQCLRDTIKTSWWESLSGRSQGNYIQVLKVFLPWLNNYSFNHENRYKVLKAYEKERSQIVKIDSTGLRQIIVLLKVAINEGAFEPKLLNYLSVLIRHSKPLSKQKRESYTLTRHFSCMPWLRELMGEEWYLIESPKLLLNSFLICISETLELAINSRTEINSLNFSNINMRTSKPYQGRNYYIICCRNLLLEAIEKRDQVNFTLMLNDFVNPKKHQQLQKLFNSGISYAGVTAAKRNKLFTKKCFLKPNLYLPYMNNEELPPSILEQTLFSWICAAQTVAPSSIPKLTRQEFIFEKAPNGVLSFVQCIYSKSRGSVEKNRTKLLSKENIEFNAISSYIEAYGKSNCYLCADIKRVTHYNKTSFGNIISRMIRLWNIPLLRTIILQKHNFSSIEPVFLNIMEKIDKSSGTPFSVWYSSQRKKGLTESYGDYVRETKNYLPISLFGLSHIKTTAVHATSDRYRSGDLLNYNSHTSETEKTSYLTDDNKDWVNQNGRITRIVMKGVQKTYSTIDFNAVINNIRSKISNHEISKLKIQAKTESDSVVLFDGLIESTIVFDTPETVVNFLHYIDQSKKHFKKLLEVNIEFVEQILLPNVEWMNFVLIQKLSPSVVKRGRADYKSIRMILPDLFEDQLRFSV